MKVYSKKMVLGGMYDLSIHLYSGGIVKYTDLKFVKVTNKGYNFLDVTTNKVLYFKKHYYMARDKFSKGDFSISFPIHIKPYLVEDTQWVDRIEETKLENGSLYWVEFEDVKAKEKVLYTEGIGLHKLMDKSKVINDYLKIKKVTFKK